MSAQPTQPLLPRWLHQVLPPKEAQETWEWCLLEAGWEWELPLPVTQAQEVLAVAEALALWDLPAPPTQH